MLLPEVNCDCRSGWRPGQPARFPTLRLSWGQDNPETDIVVPGAGIYALAGILPPIQHGQQSVNRKERREHKENFMKDMTELCNRVRQTAYEIHVYHGHGHLEKVYENALAHRLRKAGLEVTQQQPIKVYDEDGTLIGDYLADLLVERELIVELKTAKTLASEHEAQILGYLKSTRLEHGLLINFGSYKFEMRKFVWSEPAKSRAGGIAWSLICAVFAFFAVK